MHQKPQISPTDSSKKEIALNLVRKLYFYSSPFIQWMSLHRLHEPQVGKYESWMLHIYMRVSYSMWTRHVRMFEEKCTCSQTQWRDIKASTELLHIRGNLCKCNNTNLKSIHI